MRILWILTGLTFLFSAPATTLSAEQLKVLQWERPLIWRVEGPTPNYLMGTMHLPHPALAEFHPLLQEAIDQADVVYLELNMTPGAMIKATMGSMLTEAKPLKERIPAELYDRLEKVLARRNMVAGPFDGFKTWAVAMNMQVIDYAAEMQDFHPLDLAIFTKAALSGKKTAGLETVQQQLDVFNKQSEDAQVMFLEMTLTEMEKADAAGVRSADPLLKPFLDGDVIALNQYMESQMEGILDLEPAQIVEMQKLMTAMITDRDIRFAENIKRIIEEAPDTVHLFAIGAFHYTGVNNVREHLENDGLQIDRVWTLEDMRGDHPAAAGQAQKVEHSDF